MSNLGLVQILNSIKCFEHELNMLPVEWDTTIVLGGFCKARTPLKKVLLAKVSQSIYENNPPGTDYCIMVSLSPMTVDIIPVFQNPGNYAFHSIRVENQDGSWNLVSKMKLQLLKHEWGKQSMVLSSWFGRPWRKDALRHK